MARHVVRVKPVQSTGDHLDSIIQVMMLDELRKANESPAERDARESAEQAFADLMERKATERAERRAERRARRSTGDRCTLRAVAIITPLAITALVALAVSSGGMSDDVPTTTTTHGTSPAGTYDNSGRMTDNEVQSEVERLTQLLEGWGE